MAAMAALLWSCSDDSTESDAVWKEAQVSTEAPVSVSLENAVLQGRSYQNSEEIAQRGFLFATTPIDLEQASVGNINTEEVQKIVVEDLADGLFGATLQGLEIGTTCYYTAYIVLSDGAWRVGEQFEFNPDYLDVEAATPPTATVTVESYRAASVSVVLNGFGTDNLQGLDPQLFKVYDVGVYVWKEGEGSLATATKTPYNATEEEKNALAQGQTIQIALKGLRGETSYCYVPYVQIGIYRSYADYVYLMSEVVGVESTFTTEPTPAPGVKTLDATAVITRGGMLVGQIVSDAGDDQARYGFYLSTDASMLDAQLYEVTECDANGYFAYQVSGLSFNTTYYYRSFVSVREGEPDAETVYGDVIEFTTRDLSQPVLEVAAMDYAYRSKFVTLNSATITCLLTDGVDESLDLASCKVFYGTDPAVLTNEAVTDIAELVDGNTFTVTITGLIPGTTYYIKPTATNERGTSVYEKEISFRTPVSGREYLFDPTISTEGENIYLMNRMSTTLPECTDLIYYELDPIEGATTTYYLLDRNLNSRAPFVQADQGVGLSNKTQELWQRVGGLYGWGFTKPSYTWNIPGVTVLKGLVPYMWADTNPIKPLGMEWPTNPCPEGYDIPTKAQYQEMIQIASGGPVEKATLSSVFNVMRMGPTSGQKGNNGNTNEGVKIAMMHIKDGCASETGQVGVVKIQVDQTIIANYSRTNSLAIRCVRVVNK